MSGRGSSGRGAKRGRDDRALANLPSGVQVVRWRLTTEVVSFETGLLAEIETSSGEQEEAEAIVKTSVETNGCGDCGTAHMALAPALRAARAKALELLGEARHYVKRHLATRDGPPLSDSAYKDLVRRGVVTEGFIKGVKQGKVSNYAKQAEWEAALIEIEDDAENVVWLRFGFRLGWRVDPQAPRAMYDAHIAACEALSTSAEVTLDFLELDASEVDI